MQKENQSKSDWYTHLIVLMWQQIANWHIQQALSNINTDMEQL